MLYQLRPVSTGLATDENCKRPVLIDSVRFFWESKKGRTGLGPGLWPWGQKTRLDWTFKHYLEWSFTLCLYLLVIRERKVGSF